jgi:hypothetical protein
MISPYLELPVRPLAVVRLLNEIEAELASEKMSVAEKWRLRLRAGLIRSLLMPRPIA